MSENVLDDRRRSANAIKPWTDNLRRLFSSGPSGGSTGNDNDDLWLMDEWSSCSFSSVIVGVNWFLLTRSSTGVRSNVSGVSGVRALQLLSGSEMQILFTDRWSGFTGLGKSIVVVFCKFIRQRKIVNGKIQLCKCNENHLFESSSLLSFLCKENFLWNLDELHKFILRTLPTLNMRMICLVCSTRIQLIANAVFEV